jgi:hypothetical protein
MNVMGISESFKGGEGHNIRTPKSPYHDKKDSNEEKVNIVVSSFHNRGFVLLETKAKKSKRAIGGMKKTSFI